MYDVLYRCLHLPPIQHKLATIHGDEVELLATLLDLDDKISGLPFAQSADDRALWTLLLVSQVVARTGGMFEYRELLYALERAKPGVFHDDLGEFTETSQAKGWEVTWRHTRDLSEVVSAVLAGGAIVRFTNEGEWSYTDPKTGEPQRYEPCPNGAAESLYFVGARLMCDWYGDDDEIEATVELTSAGGWIELLTVHRVADPAPEDLTHSEIAASVAASNGVQP